ncbi:WhiB family transcriptional regulator [Streptomyces sp. NPDC046977]|uniref:WhiB family transcriptional regulator n=1 Tax=Streptomyces sp. NPDC046977 TaxID=3154703 RepID=UPI00340A0A0E
MISVLACLTGTRHPDTWHSTNPAEQAEARAVCQACPARVACRTRILAAEAGLPALDRAGIHAGLDPEERAALDPTIPTAPVRQLKGCGTEAAQRRHQRKGETCDRCHVGTKAVAA